MSRFSYFAILGIMRTGSNLLEQSLNQFPSLHCYGELFNPGFMGHEGVDRIAGMSLTERDKDPLDLLGAIRKETGDKLPGIRAFPDHDARVWAHILADPDCAKIILRRDLIDSFISLQIARQTGQWRLGGVATRKTAKVVFDSDAFETYKGEAERHYAQIDRALQLSGQAAFRLRYEEVLDQRVIHGAAQFLGEASQLDAIKTPTKKQNPESYADKIVNFDEFTAYFVEVKQSVAQDTAFAPTSFDFRKSMAATERALLYVPMPGLELGDAEAVLKSGGPVKRLKTADDIADWTGAQDRPRSFTIIADPLERAYRAFWHYVMPGPRMYKNVSARLEQNFDVAPLEPSAHADAVRASFSAFVKFLKGNLAGQTAIRIADSWASQSTLLERMTKDVAITDVVRFSRAGEFLDHAIPPTLDLPDGAVPLSEVVTDEQSALAQEIYAKDYSRFGQKF